MTHAFRQGKAFICQNPACKKKFYKHGYASNSAYRHLWGNDIENLREQIRHYEAEGWRQDGEISESTYNNSAWVNMQKINHQEYGPFFHSQGCMHEWIGDNIPEIYNILLAQNNNSVNIPE